MRKAMDAGRKPLISVVAIFHNMRREAPRTLFSLSRQYQRDTANLQYEVIAIDNGSDQPLDSVLVERHGPHFRYHYHDTDSASPVGALNRGAAMARGTYLLLLIDGARILSPGILRAVQTLAPAYPAPFVYTLGLHLGPDVQNASIQKGYNQQAEDRLLRSVAWRDDGYQLFRIATLATSSNKGYLGALSESNCFAMRRDKFERLGGLDERFTSPGGGLANLDFFARACTEPDAQPVLLLGEGTFHQVHGGIATNATPDAHPMEKFREEYRAIRGWEWEPNQSLEPVYFGKLPGASRRFLGPPDESPLFIGPRSYSRPEQPAASCVLVLGMHRSGTSALAKTVEGMGFPVAGEPLPPRAGDNDEGYWESRRVLEINNSFLHVIGQHWASTGAISPALFVGENADLHRHEIRQFLREVIASKQKFMIKDPRLCRLLPLWQPVFMELEIDFTVLIIHREPGQVFRSLARRAGNPEIATAAVADPTQAYLLWIRYYVDAEHNTRECNRQFIDYELWTKAPAEETPRIERHIAETLGVEVLTGHGVEPRRRDNVAATHADNDLVRLAITVRQQLVASDLTANARVWLDKLHHVAEVQVPERHHNGDSLPELTAIANTCKVITGSVPSDPADWPTFTRRARWFGSKKRPIVFVSDHPDSRSQIYRVKNAVDALNRAGTPAFWTTSQQLLQSAEVLANASRVIIHRSELSPGLAKLIDTCRSHKVALSFDMDDQLFDPQLIAAQQIHFINSLPEEEQRQWEYMSRRLLAAAHACGHVICSTEVLADRARELGLQATVIENGFSRENLDLAAHWRAQGATLKDRPRIGYANGTPTHGGDFAVVLPALAQWLESNPDWTLSLIGEDDIAPDLSIINHAQLELRPMVSPVNLYYELARLDINIIPLENSPFCTSKSPLKWYESALAGTPSIASATRRYTELFADQSRGLTANTAQQWHDQIDRLARDRQLREELARNARHYCEENFFAGNLADRYLSL